MSRRGFYFALGCVLTWGFFATHLVSQATATWHPSFWMFLFVGLVLPIVGILLSGFSSNAIISFIGFNLVVIPFGAILGPVLAQYELTQPGAVTRAALLTATVTALMGVSGLMFPQFYKNIGGALFMALLCLLGVRVLQMFVPNLQNVGFIDYLAAGLFALYIGYDMWRASDIPATLDNAVDVAVSLYLDIINLFLSLLKASSDD
ncbi:MAG: Bax inhibitor-1 family protein [Candidatus Moraniibacteriota bacterium]